jgi:anion transporter
MTIGATAAQSPSTGAKTLVSGKKRKDTIFGINKIFFLLAASVVAFLITRIPIAGLMPQGRVALGLFIFTVCLWIFEIFPTGVSSVLFGVLLVIFLGDKTMPTSIAFAGFTNTNFFLILGAFLIGEAMVKSGVAERIALLVLRLGGSSHTRVLVFAWIASVLLGLFTPSGTVRVAMMVPIITGIVVAYKAPAASNFAANLFLHFYWASMTASNLWYTGSNVNPLAMGIGESFSGYEPAYITYTLWQVLPSIVLAVGCFFVINFVVRPEKEIVAQGRSVEFISTRLSELGPMQPAEKRALGIMSLAVLLWITQPWHGIDSAWVAVGAATLLFLPRLGVLSGKALNNISWDTLLLLGVALGIGGILKATGLDVWITKTLLNPMLAPFDDSGELGIVFGIALVTALIHFLMASGTSETSAVAPLMAQWAQTQNFNITLTVLAVSRAAQNILIFPYQSTPMVAMWGTGYMSMRKAVIGFGACSIFNLLWITAMAPYWNWIMGIIK